MLLRSLCAFSDMKGYRPGTRFFEAIKRISIRQSEYSNKPIFLKVVESSNLIHVDITVLVIVFTPKFFKVFDAPSSSPASLAFNLDQNFNNGRVFRIMRHSLTSYPQRLKCVSPAATSHRYAKS